MQLSSLSSVVITLALFAVTFTTREYATALDLPEQNVEIANSVENETIRWNAFTRFTTANGTECSTPCEKRGRDYYWCYTHERLAVGQNKYGSWGYCSPEVGLDYRGNPCVGDCERNPSDSSYWCLSSPTEDASSNVNSKSYCGQTLPQEGPLVVAQYKTRYGEYCLTECSKSEGTKYSWCRTGERRRAWDYCSETPGYSRYGSKCKTRCDYHGYSYTWCYLEKGSWDYCGVRSVSSEQEYTWLGSKCITPCKMEQGDNENMCFDGTRKQIPCSILANLTTSDEQCTSECSTRGGNDTISKALAFQWCTNIDLLGQEFDSVCGNVVEDNDVDQESNNMRFSKEDIPENVTISGDIANIYRYTDEQGSNRVTFYERLERDWNNMLFEDGQGTVQLWFSECLHNWLETKRSLPATSQNVSTVLQRSDEKGDEGVALQQIERNVRNIGVGDEEYVTLQMNVYGNATMEEEVSTIAELQIPAKLVEKDPSTVRRSFIESVRGGFAVHIASFVYN